MVDCLSTWLIHLYDKSGRNLSEIQSIILKIIQPNY